MSDHPAANWGPGHPNYPRLTPKVKRTPEAQADIAAARAAPTEAEREAEALDAELSNAALADTPAVREMGGRRVRDVDGAILDLPREAIVLTGPEAERYRAITAAARKAQASSAAARADSAALLQLFQAFCAGLAPGKEG